MQYVTLPNYINKQFEKISNYTFTLYHNDIVFNIISYVLPNTLERYYHHISICYQLGMLLEDISLEKKRDLLDSGISFFKKIKKGGISHFRNNVNTLSKILLISLNNNQSLKYNVIDIEPYIINVHDIEDIIGFSTHDELYALYQDKIKLHLNPKPFSMFYFCHSILHNIHYEHTSRYNIDIPKHICKVVSDNVYKFKNILSMDFEHKDIFERLFQIFNDCCDKSEWNINDTYKVDILLNVFARSKMIYHHKFDKVCKNDIMKHINLSKFLVNSHEKSILDNNMIIQSPISKFCKINKQYVYPYSVREMNDTINILCHNIGGASYDLDYHLNIYKNNLDIDMCLKNMIMCFQEVSNKNIKNTFNQLNDEFKYVNCRFLNFDTLNDYCKNNYRYGNIISNFEYNNFIDVKNTMYEKNLHLKDEIDDVSHDYSNLKALKLMTKFVDIDPKYSILNSFHSKQLPSYAEFIKMSYKKSVVNIHKKKIMIHKIANQDLYYVYCDERLNTGKDISKNQLMMIFPKSFLNPDICNLHTHFVVGNLRNTMGHMFLGMKNSKRTECIINTHLQSGDQFGTKDAIAMNEFINLMGHICGSRYDEFFKYLDTIYIVGDFNLNSDIILMLLQNSIRVHNHFKNHNIYILFDNVKTHSNYERRKSQDMDQWDTIYNKTKNKTCLYDTDITWIQNEMKRSDITSDQYENLSEIMKNVSDIKYKGCIDNIIVITNKTLETLNLDVGHRKSTIKTAKQFHMIYKGDDITKLKNFKYNENRLDLQNINQLSQYFLSDHSPIYTSIKFKKNYCKNFLKPFLSI